MPTIGASPCLEATSRPSRKRLRLLVQLAFGAPFTLMASAALADSGPPCQKGGATACQIIYTEGSAGHGDTGGTGQAISSTFNTPRTLTAIDGSAGWGAIQLESYAGAGGDADHDGGDGGHGGQGNTVSATIGLGVTAQGANSGGILRFVSVGGNGGGGQGDHVGSPGTGGTGGGGGEVDVTMNGAITSSAGDSPGLSVLSQGGSSLTGDSGGDGFFGAESGSGGGSAFVNVNIGGTINTVGTGASINAWGGAGGAGVNDTGGVSETQARAGGDGGTSTQAMTVTVSGSIASAQADGIDVQAIGGVGGKGGNAAGAPSSSSGGNGGNGGSAPNATLTLAGSSQIYGSQIGALVTSIGGAGGAGGTSGNANISGGGVGGAGGNGGEASLTVESGARVTGTGTAALIAQSAGGTGGAGGAGEFINNSDIGGNGGKGGLGGSARVDVGPTASGAQATTLVATSPGIAAMGSAAISLGGDGGAAAAASSGTYAKGGIGGSGNQAGNATVTIEGTATVTTLGPDSPSSSAAVLPGVLARSSGGAGGAGGNADAGIGAVGGSAGAGGAGGMATTIINGAVNTSGSYAYGVLAQSLGGMGAAGGDADSVFGSHGGAAKNGGAGGSVYMSGQSGTVTTTGTGASAMVGQSIGGGGGAGGTATSLGAGGSIGGNGGAGGNGGNVTVGLLATDGNSAVLSDTLITRGDSAIGVIGQSVGGAGGNGGNSVAVGLMIPTFAIGGDGKSGGIGGTVNVRNDGIVTTFGQQSGGVEAQSVGGGGGNGGTGVAINAGVQISTSFALGGVGATGGTGGTVNLSNNGQVSTYGADAYGLKAQSISGGGGQGGSALATAIALGGDPEFPTVSVSIALGGSGGAGGDQSQSPVTVNNNGLITTAGDGSVGIIAQNIAGGGGNGGDATSASYSNGGSEDSTNVSVSSSVGGKGGGGGTAGSATVNNYGLVATYGADAYGVFAQSVAGGGGVGGTGDASASAGTGNNTFTSSITVGGQGGQGGTAGSVTINNYLPGNVATKGDGANALFAQSVGGGGGASGGGTAKANGGNLTASVTVGGNAGSGGQGGIVTVTNQALLLTQGADADAVLAQSIGGGGGKAGKGASTTGGAQSAQQAVNQMSNTIANGLGQNSQDVTKLADGVYKVGDEAWKGINSLSQLQNVLDASVSSVSLHDDDDEDGNSANLKLNATVGGQGGVGGTGGQVTVNNSGLIQTTGTKSDGIFAQSIGGGGGLGGASSFSASQTSGGDDNGSTSGSLKVGGSGAGAGSGGTVNVTNTGSITTNGVTSYGINAQSVGGGGGKGGAMAASGGALKDFNVTLGGSGGAGGAGGNVAVTNDGSIATNERESVALLAQSVGGGGGTAHLLSSNVAASDADSDMKLSLSIGGTGGAGGAGGATTVDIGQSSAGTIRTFGVGGIGVVAQSIGGGGGVLTTTSAQADAQGGGNGGGIQSSTQVPITIGDANGSSGDGGAVNVTLGKGSTGSTSSILTSKADAYGILAQSIGGGGGLFAGATPSTELAKLYAGTAQNGNGGSVNVLLNNGGWVYTSGAGAIGVFAQSIGGGGGVIGGMQNVDLSKGLQANPTSESGQGGNVSVDLENGGNIVTAGNGAHGILAQALGGGGGVVAGANNTGYAYAGSTPYSNCNADTCTGNVTVTMGNNTVVQTHGAGAYGIYVQSRGNGTNDATINIGHNAYVESEDKSAGGIYLEAAGTNTVINAGSIAATSAGLAIGSDMGSTTVHNTSSGVITGSINLKLGSGSGTVQNDAGGKLNTGVSIAADSVRNDGTLDVGGAGAAGATTQLTGQLAQSSTGRIVIDSDHVAGTSDRLTVRGDAQLAGKIEMRPSRLSPTTVQVVDVMGALDDTQLASADPMLVHYQLATVGTQAADGSSQQSILVTPQARFDSAASGLGKNAQSVASHLQANFNAGSGGLGAPLALLSLGVQDLATYKAALTSLGNEAQQAVGTSRLAASHAFVERMNSCPTFDQPVGAYMKERECLWGRAIDNRTTATGSEHANYSAGTHSVQIGAQRRIADGWFLGASAAYDNEDFNSSTGAGSVNGSGGAVGLVLKHEIENWTISGAADFGYGSYDTTRNIAFPGYMAQATGSFNLTQAGLHSRIAYLIPQDAWYLKPYLDLHAVHMHTGSYSEQGAGALGLNVNGNSDTMYSASPMIELGGRVAMDNGMTMRPYAAVGATFHDRNEWGAQAQFQGAAQGVQPFVTAASAPTSLANVRLGVNLLVKSNLELKAEYSGQFGSGYRSNEGILRVNYLF